MAANIQDDYTQIVFCVFDDNNGCIVFKDEKRLYVVSRTKFASSVTDNG